MEPALDVVGRALLGDEAARGFLERTSSIYVLDVTDPSKPKTYGCWNFIHQALNEAERLESRSLQFGKSSDLVPQLRLVASMAHRVARRSPASEKAIVATCISNASDYHCSDSQVRWLFDLNSELREIVMGRIAATAFDFSFHRRNGLHAVSAFSDYVVIDTLSAILAANAVATGPAAVKHFATEWIIPSSRSIPVFALLSVVHHLAQESMRKSSPASTIDMLQQLSVSVTSMVVAPALADAATDNAIDDDAGDAGGTHTENARILTKALSCLHAWCRATCLTLPQLKHVCTKVNLKIVDILSDAMYSDSSDVVGALADLIEAAMLSPFEEGISEERMNQVRHIIQVDESAFNANFSYENLRAIEYKEMGSIVDELVSSIGLQRVRFSERQMHGDHQVCHNLVRIAHDVCNAWIEVHGGSQFNQQPERGIVSFLLKAAAHPSLNTSALALTTLTRFVRPDNSVHRELLPLLQRKAIVPHRLDSDALVLTSMEQCGVDIDEFMRFRSDVIADAFNACCRIDCDGYLNSCTSAIEEFCSEEASVQVSFHLEAAVFCVEVVSEQLLEQGKTLASTERLQRCLNAVSSKPESLSSNPLTLARLCLLLGKYARWFKDHDLLPAGCELARETINLGMARIELQYFRTIIDQTSVAPLEEASHAMKQITSADQQLFVSETNLQTLVELWKAIYGELEAGKIIGMGSILPLGEAICSLAICLPSDMRPALFESVAVPVLSLIGRLLAVARETDGGPREQILGQLACELDCLSAITNSFSLACATNGGSNGVVSKTQLQTTSERQPPLPPSVVLTLRLYWTSIATIANELSEVPDVARSLAAFQGELIAPEFHDETTKAWLNDIYAVISSMPSKMVDDSSSLLHVGSFLERFLSVHYVIIEEGAQSILSSGPIAPDLRETSGRSLVPFTEKMILDSIVAVRDSLGPAWKHRKEQRRGQSAFERRSPPPSPHQDSSTSPDLCPLLSLMQKTLLLCPVFCLNLPAGPGWDVEQDSLIRQTTDAAVPALSSADSTLAIQAMEYLFTMLDVSGQSSRRQEDSQQPDAAKAHVHAGTMQCLSMVRSESIARLLTGCCGKYEHGVLEPAGRLLYGLVTSFPGPQIESDLVSALQPNVFALGEGGKGITLAVFHRCTQGTCSVSDLVTFLEEIWEIHHSDDTTALPASDAVARLIRRYTL